MKFVKPLTDRVKKFVKQRGGVLPKLFVWIYSSLFIGCGLVTIFGVLHEFYTKGSVNYVAVNNFIKEYFCPSIAGTFTVLGVLLIDKDKDGIPDQWENQEEKEVSKRDN